ncbi:MAG: thioesterase family protein [Pseudomonadota bacterium]|nr:thioesterase family protein [Pseudomonadota bacterium]
MSPIEIPADFPIFHQDGELLLPTHLATGPWYPGTQHGSAMLLMAAIAVERVATEAPRQVTRLTVDMMNAAPLSAIELQSDVRRGGRNVETLDVSILAAGKECVRASAMRYRLDTVPVVDRLKFQGTVPALPAPLPVPLFRHVLDKPGFHHAIEIRVDVTTQPAVMWIRLQQPVLPEQAVTPFMRVALAADWTYSIPAIANRILTGEAFDAQPFFGINPDTTINLHRPAEGEWIGIQTHATYEDLGAGTVVGQIFDEGGPVGICTQSILIRHRG